MNCNNEWLNVKSANQGMVTDCAPLAGIKQSTVTVKSTNTVEPGTPASVINEGTVCDAQLVFNIPKGENGSSGESATVNVKGTNTIPYGQPASVVNDGIQPNAWLTFNIPEGKPGINGESATVDAGTATSLPYGANPTVTNSGTTTDAIFDFGIPQGKPGKGIKSVATTSTDPVTGDYINTVTYDDNTTDLFKSPIGPAGKDSTFLGSCSIKLKTNTTTNQNDIIPLISLLNWDVNIASLTPTNDGFILNKGLYRMNLSVNCKINKSCSLGDKIIIEMLNSNAHVTNFVTTVYNESGFGKICDEVWFNVSVDNSIIKLKNINTSQILVETYSNGAYNISLQKVK